MLGYAEVYTDIKSIQVSTLSLELRASVDCDKNNNFDELFVNDAAEIGIMINNKRRELILVEWRNHTNNEVQILKEIKLSSISEDKISQFRVRPPELRYLFKSVEQNNRWFCKSKNISVITLDLILHHDVRKRFFIDDLQNQIQMKRKAIPEINNYFSQVKIKLGNSDISFSHTERESVSIMKDFFEEIFIAIDGLHEQSYFTIFVMENLV